MRHTAFGVLLSLAVFAAPAAAQPDPLVRPLPPAAAGTETLGRFLRELAYEPKALSPDVFQITIERERWPVHMMLSLSTDGRRVWLECKFAPIEQLDRVPAETWRKLLEINEKIGPAHFAFNATDKRVHLYKAFDNVGVTTDRLQREIELFDSTVRKTQDYWRGENFRPVIASAPEEASVRTTVKPPALPVARVVSETPKLAGEWSITEIVVRGRKVPEQVLRDRKASLTIREARDGDIGPPLRGKLMADLQTGPDSKRTVYVQLGPDGAGQIDFVDDQERAEQGIYKLDGDTLTLCFAAVGEVRPTAFNAIEEARCRIFKLTRKK